MRSQFLISLALAATFVACGEAAPTSPAASVTEAQYAPNDPTGTWRFVGLAGKCLDVGGYPRGNGTPVILYTCNGTPAQAITVAPANDAGTEFELRAHGRCLGVQGAIASGSPIVLARCDGSRAQRFVHTSFDGVKISPADAPKVYLTVSNASGADRTPIILSGWSPAPPDGPEVQAWDLDPIDTTPYTAATPLPETGTIALVGLASKCLDIGGGPYPPKAPAILYGCNGTLAQRFTVAPIAGGHGDVELHAAGRCLEVAPDHEQRLPPPVVFGLDARADIQIDPLPVPRPFPFPGPTTPYFAGADIALTECAGRATQRFGIEVYDATYVFPAAHPEFAIGVRGAVSDNRTPIELQARGSFPSDQWRVVDVEGAGYAPTLPKLAFGRTTATDHRGGGSKTITIPALTLVDTAQTETKLSILYRTLGVGPFSEIGVSGAMSGTGASRMVIAPFAKNHAYEVKVHVEGPGGVAESTPFTVDTRTPPTPTEVTISNIKSDEVTLSWHGPGTPRVDDYSITYTHEGYAQMTAGTGPGEFIYTKTIGGLQSNTHYTFMVYANNGLWGQSDYAGISADIVTPSDDNGGGGGGPSSVVVCGTSGLGCPPDDHAAAYLHSTACSSSGVEDNATRCDPNVGLSFNACGEPGCPSGWHATGFSYQIGCDLQTSTGSLDPNTSTCVQDSSDFWTCGSCPAGYAVTGQQSNTACDGYTQNHCHRN